MLNAEPDTPRGALALEACRTADRLDELDSVIAGRGVLELMQFRTMLGSGNGLEDFPIHVKVEFSNVLAEARQQQMAFKQLIAALEPDSAAPAEVPAESQGKGTPLDELKKRRAQRQPGSAGRGHPARQLD